MIGAVLGPLGGVVSSIIGGVGSLAVGVAKTAGRVVGIGGEDANDKERKKRGMKAEGEGSGMSEEEMNKKMDKGGYSDKTSDDEDEEKPKLFGGLDLAGMKSQIDGPMGPPEPETPVKGGVYKQIFAVNKSMLASLLRIEETMRMLLSVEYERIQQMISGDTEKDRKSRDKKIKEGDTDPKGEKKKGLFGRAAAGVGSMLGGAYGKVKGSFGGNIMKALGLTALILLFKKYEDDLAIATQEFLKSAKSIFEYFTAEDFTIGKLKKDFKEKFLPAILNTINMVLETIYNWVADKLFNRGDAAVEKGVQSKGAAEKNLLDMVGQEGVASGFDKPNIITTKDIGRFLDSSTLPGGRVSKVLTKDQQTQANQSFNEYLESMIKVSQASSGRIQWSGLDTDMSDKGSDILRADISTWSDADSFKFMLGIGATPSTILNSLPIIDGNIVPMETLDGLNLMQYGGMNMTMSQDEKDNITDLLSQKSVNAAILSAAGTEQYQMGGKGVGMENKNSNFGIGIYGERVIEGPFSGLISKLPFGKADMNEKELEALKIAEAANIEIEALLAIAGQDFSMTTDYQKISGVGTTKSSQDLQSETKIKTKGGPMEYMQANNTNNITTAPTQITNMVETVNHNMDLSANNDNRTVQTFFYRQVAAGS